MYSGKMSKFNNGKKDKILTKNLRFVLITALHKGLTMHIHT